MLRRDAFVTVIRPVAGSPTLTRTGSSSVVMATRVRPTASRTQQSRSASAAAPIISHSVQPVRLPTTQPATPRTNTAPYYATMGIAPDLMEATKKAVRRMLAYLVREHGLTREEAYVLSSVALDLKISEIVDIPNWVVSMTVPRGIFVA